MAGIDIEHPLENRLGLGVTASVLVHQAEQIERGHVADVEAQRPPSGRLGVFTLAELP